MQSRIGLICGLLVALTSIVVQIGWVIHSIALVQIDPAFSPMKFNTALAFLFCALNLIFFRSSSRLFRASGLIASTIALITLSQYVLHNNNGIDSFFLTPFTHSHSLYIGRMSPATGVYFVLLGVMLAIAANFPNNTSLRTFVVFVTSIIIALTLVPLFAYMSGIETAFLWSIFTEMALHTAVCFILLGTGLICTIWFNTKDTPFFLIIPVVLCLTTAAFVTSGALKTYENVRHQELLKEEAYYKSGATGAPTFNSELLHRNSIYIAYFVLFFGLLTAVLLSVTLYFRLKWLQNAKALASSEERLHLAITGTTDGLFDWDVLTGDFYFSPRFEDVLGFQNNVLAPRYDNFVELIHPQDKDRFADAITEHFRLKTPINIDLRLKNKTGHYIWFNFRGTTTYAKNSNVTRVTGFVSDISVRNEIDTMKNEFISTVSHELRTPMTSIRGSLSLILSGKVGACENRIRDLLVIADRNCDRLLRLINDILDIEKIEAGEINFKLVKCDLAKVVQESVSNNQMYAAKSNIKLLYFPIKDINVVIDVDRVLQVLTNLISNAVNFSKTGDTVTITMHCDQTWVRVNIIDQGPGITEKFKKLIFQKFSQADASTTREGKGSGLGLSISKAIIEKLNGTLHFTSTLGEGSTFYFELPIASE